MNSIELDNQVINLDAVTRVLPFQSYRSYGSREDKTFYYVGGTVFFSAEDKVTLSVKATEKLFKRFNNTEQTVHEKLWSVRSNSGTYKVQAYTMGGALLEYSKLLPGREAQFYNWTKAEIEGDMLTVYNSEDSAPCHIFINEIEAGDEELNFVIKDEGHTIQVSSCGDGVQMMYDSISSEFDDLIESQEDDTEPLEEEVWVYFIKFKGGWDYQHVSSKEKADRCFYFWIDRYEDVTVKVAPRRLYSLRHHLS